MEIRLPDRTELIVRSIRADDKTALSAALGRLSVESARSRFLAPKPRFSSAELRYLTEVDGIDHFALVAELVEEPGAIVGVGRFVRDPRDPETAEFAIVVGDAYQRRGLGRRLSQLLVEAALERGVRRFTATSLSDNAAVRRLIESMSRRLEYVRTQNGVDEVVLDLAA